MEPQVNKYVTTYISNYIQSFRNSVRSQYVINIRGLADFITANDHNLSYLLQQLLMYGFDVSFSIGPDTIDEIQVEYTIKENIKKEKFEYKIYNLIPTIFLSSKTGISIVGILVMQIISQLICKTKTMYKAIILDLDDTVWKGTIAEDGLDIIKQNLRSDDTTSFVTFMRFIKEAAKELGLYVAICTRNDIEVVQTAIDSLNDDEFPLKRQIDCIVANYSDKSINIKAIAQKLSILTNACIFIDDNPLVRDEVRQNLPDVFVPDWKNHDELLFILITCGVLDRFELSIRSRNRKRLFEVLRREREKSYLPQLFVKVSDDTSHVEAVRLYAKSNQFKFAGKNEVYEGCKSLVFEIYRDNGENLGICSAITYTENEQEVQVLNWAISCRYFEIGLEEYILMYIYTLSGKRSVKFTFNDTGCNGKTIELIEKYKGNFIKDDMDEDIYFTPNIQSISDIQHNTNLKEYCNE